MMKRILSSVPDSGRCVEYWRNIVPLLDLSERDDGIDVDFFEYQSEGNQCSWVRHKQASCFFSHHPLTTAHLHMIEIARFVERPVWLDLDDNYWEVSPKNQAIETYDNHVLSMLNAAIGKASVISVSTDPLAEKVKRVSPKSKIVRVANAIPDSITWPSVGRKKTIIYRGSYKSHAADLYSVAADFQAIINENPDWSFVFYGGHPVFLDGPNVEYVGPTMIPIFHSILGESQASIMVNPLEFSHFNECKSNIAWIESAIAGAAFLGPDLAPYREPGASVYKPGKFGQRLRDLIAMTDLERGQLVQRSQKAIDEKYRLSVVNPIRSQIMREL